MKKTEELLLSDAIAAANKGISLKINEAQRADAEELVKRGLCFWSLDYDHIAAYDKH